MKTVTGVFLSVDAAERAIRDLERQGISNDNIDLIAGNDQNRHDEYLKKSKEASTSTGAAAASAASIGGGFGIIATLAALSIPGVGPIIAGGAMATILAGMGVGAAAGGLLGAFKNMGISHEEAPLYEEAVRRGAVIAIAKVDESMEQDAVAAMRQHGARDIQDVADTWKASGWNGPSSDPHPYTSDSSVRTGEMPERVKTSSGS
jgi:hypothetical protein